MSAGIELNLFVVSWLSLGLATLIWTVLFLVTTHADLDWTEILSWNPIVQWRAIIRLMRGIPRSGQKGAWIRLANGSLALSMICLAVLAMIAIAGVFS